MHELDLNMRSGKAKRGSGKIAVGTTPLLQRKGTAAGHPKRPSKRKHPITKRQKNINLLRKFEELFGTRGTPFVEQCRAWAEIKDEKLYRKMSPSWEDCRGKF